MEVVDAGGCSFAAQHVDPVAWLRRLHVEARRQCRTPLKHTDFDQSDVGAVEAEHQIIHESLESPKMSPVLLFCTHVAAEWLQPSTMLGQ